jgi:nucleotide-binding universal stress UspA family protein
MTAPKILVAVELDAWKPTVSVARELAQRYGAELVALHVVMPMCNVYPDLPSDLFAQAMQEVESASRRIIEAIAAEAGATPALRLGDPVTEILAAIAELHASHVVIGTHGRHGIRRALLGSVAERVVRGSPVPVTVVPTGAALAA